MALILAIEPDRRQAAQLTTVIRKRVGAELILVDTTERALDAIGGRMPDLVLVPALLSPQDDAALAAALRVIAAAARVQMLTIPVLGGAKPATRAGGVLSALRRGKAKQAEPDGCDPGVFAEQILSYLERAAQERGGPIEIEFNAPAAVEPVQAVAPATVVDDFTEALDSMNLPPEAPAADVAEEIELPRAFQPATAFARVPLSERVAFARVPAYEPAATFEAAPAVVDDEWLEEANHNAAVDLERTDAIEDAVAAADVSAGYATPPADAAESTGGTDESVSLALEQAVWALFSDDAAAVTPDEPAAIHSDPPPPEPMSAEWSAVEELMAALEALPLVAIELAEGNDDDAWTLPAIDESERFAERPERVMEDPDGDDLDPTTELKPQDLPPGSLPVAAKSEREWFELIESLRHDVERLRVERADKPALKPSSRSGRAAKKVKPVQDEWGLFDPEQCGFAALLAKLDEVTDADDGRL